MHRSRRLILAGAVAAAASLPIAFVTLPTAGPINGIDGKAWPAAAALAAAAFLAILPDRAEPPSRAWAGAWAVLVAGASALAVAKVVDAFRAASDGSGSVGPGVWVLLAGVLLSAAGGVVSFSRRI